MPRIRQLCLAGMYLVHKYEAQALTSGYERAARNLRKQGYSLAQARCILLGVL